jgi:hypothetical protein
MMCVFTASLQSFTADHERCVLENLLATLRFISMQIATKPR